MNQSRSYESIMEATEEVSDIVPNRPIIAIAGTRYRITHYIMVVVILIMAAWFAYDGFYNWPREIRENEAAEAAGLPRPHEKKRTQTEVLIQKVLALSLPVMGVGLLAWCIWQSRGRIRFEAGTLHVPGHPPVTLEEMRSIDNDRWDKKGIALIGYEAAGGRGTIKLDDYHYEREPVDKIQKIVTERLTPKKTHGFPVIQPPPPSKTQRAENPVAMPPRPRLDNPRE